MTREILETPLPGVGVRYSFESDNGNQIAVLHHHSGRQRVFVCRSGDPDAKSQVLDLTSDDSQTLADLLGSARTVLQTDRIQQSVAGLTIEWLVVPEASPATGQPIEKLDLGASTGVTVLAALRAGEVLRGPDLQLEAGDTLVVVGRREAINRVRPLLHA